MESRLLRKHFDIFPYAMCLPAVVLFFLFVLLPFLNGLWISFHSWDGFSDMRWAGIRNYGFVLKDEIFWVSLRNTFVFAFLVTLVKNVTALSLAFILVKKFPGKTLFRTGIYLPVTLSYVVIGVLWVWIYNPTFGLLNSFFTALGSGEKVPGWLSNPDIALYSVAVVDIWKWIGYHMVLYIAGLQSISKELFKAADIDGAGGLQKIFFITLPQLNSVIVVNVIMSVTGAFVSNFDIVNIMTGGGPMNSTEVSLTYIVKTAFRYSNMGKANAMSMLLFALVFLCGFIQMRLMTKEDVYE
jgi:ABC-type sugar transport system permease subunit